MACDLTQIQNAACASGIGRNRDKISLLQIIAQLTCEASQSGGGSGVPSGVILMWSGTIASIPSGWVFCDGTNGTPNLINRFIIAASVDDGGVAMTTIDATGGGGIPTQTGGGTQHNHGIIDPGHFHFALNSETDLGPGASPGVTDEFSTTTNTTGITETQLATIVPPYYALAYIMKT